MAPKKPCEGDRVERHYRESGARGVRVGHGAPVEGRGRGEGEAGLAAEEELEGNEGGVEVGGEGGGHGGVGCCYCCWGFFGGGGGGGNGVLSVSEVDGVLVWGGST